MTDGGTQDAGAIVRHLAGAHDAAPTAAQLLFQWQLVIIAALTMVFIVELIRDLPWTIAASQRFSSDAKMVGILYAFFFVGGVAFLGVAGTFMHLLPASGLAILLLGLRRRRS